MAYMRGTGPCVHGVADAICWACTVRMVRPVRLLYIEESPGIYRVEMTGAHGEHVTGRLNDAEYRACVAERRRMHA